MTSELMRQLRDAARELAQLLAAQGVRVVFAESCTAGLASAVLATVPGVSQWHCGSAVTYREATKSSWLDVSAEDIAQWGVVSEPVARQMAEGVLHATPEADIAVAITGHLGPHAPAELDGVACLAAARRQDDGSPGIVRATRVQLAQQQRELRQQEAARLVLELACAVIPFPFPEDGQEDEPAGR